MTWFVRGSPEELKPDHRHPITNLSSCEWTGREDMGTLPVKRLWRDLRCGEIASASVLECAGAIGFFCGIVLLATQLQFCDLQAIDFLMHCLANRA